MSSRRTREVVADFGSIGKSKVDASDFVLRELAVVVLVSLSEQFLIRAAFGPQVGFAAGNERREQQSVAVNDGRRRGVRRCVNPPRELAAFEVDGANTVDCVRNHLLTEDDRRR